MPLPNQTLLTMISWQTFYPGNEQQWKQWKEKDSAVQEQDNYSITASPSLPFPPSPIKSGGSPVSDHPVHVMDAAQLQAVAEWREEFERACAYRVQQDKEGKA